MSFGESGGHWYHAPSGEPFYMIGERGVTLRDARNVKAVPSVTTVTSVIDKPALTNWKCEQVILAALTMPRGEDSEGEYVKRIIKDGLKQAVDAANIGTEIHDACEQLVKTGSCQDQYRQHADAAVAELRRLFPEVNDWVAEKSFAHPLGFGGKVDLHSPSTGIVVDYKTKIGPLIDGKRLAYDQNIQLAAYQVGLEIRPQVLTTDDGDETYYEKRFTQCANIFVSRTHPGAVASHVWSAEDVARGWETFDAALRLWKILKQYDGSY